ncbi:DUF4212 domain-containing protein [Marinibactrum halimedae]|uniref:Sodium symporter small subunit domain-containing protein n=1 Tax=Marinibactrum halimedae TaxID=1444977 RepID=A0AA37T5X8_9GAMM|nr:DUF4212 domain-containing protein [Marinibactrum halimedae]MCD9460159.1 DUF4212 domain-containing protein [Marinibactrum halimedae]GLS26371.1 hypothetical protein GCM10007877_20860 [Marinibactrum halimedae]
MSDKTQHNKYWQENLKIIVPLMVVWFVVSFGCGIIFVDELNNIRLGGYKLGFWFAQQGSIYCFVLLIYIYTKQMAKLDKKYSLDDDNQ